MNIINIKNIKNNNKYFLFPSSKSILNRILFLISIYKNNILIIKNLNLSEDTKIMLKIISYLGIKIKKKKSNYCLLNNGFFFYKKYFYFGNAGTVSRPFITLLSFIIKKPVILNGNKNMQSRTIKELIKNLIKIGGKIKYLNHKGFLPILIKPSKLKENSFTINGQISSQFTSSFLLVLFKIIKTKFEFLVFTEISKSYITLTLKVLILFNISVIKKNNKYIIYPQKLFLTKEINIEKDFSAILYFFSIPFFINQNILIKNIYLNSIQYELKFLNILKKIGLLFFKYKNNIYIKYIIKRIYSLVVNCLNIPDSCMILLILSKIIKKIKIFNIRSWNFKETNRIKSMSNELKKYGFNVFYKKNWIFIKKKKNKEFVKIKTYLDHRIAMCFSLYFNKYISIINPNCVKKTFPSFFLGIKKCISYLKY
ncbi:3-phosphoshikimate 1-carboxyvinyltransferase [Candidatus Vidania fulgoroideorum]